jgi:hypothetical protein
MWDRGRWSSSATWSTPGLSGAIHPTYRQVVPIGTLTRTPTVNAQLTGKMAPQTANEWLTKMIKARFA